MSMNHINVSSTVDRNVDEAAQRFEEFLREFAPETEMTFTLRAPFDLSALNVGFTLQRDVTARITPLGEARRAYAIAWQPVEPGPFPSLSGTIFIAASEADPKKSIITLDGHYHAPLGVAGEVFDALIGKHIAQASAEDLMERVGAYVGNVIVPVADFHPVTELIPFSEFA
jgi:hypothetical protein